jgi:hypothetical protein
MSVSQVLTQCLEIQAAFREELAEQWPGVPQAALRALTLRAAASRAASLPERDAIRVGFALMAAFAMDVCAVGQQLATITGGCAGPDEPALDALLTDLCAARAAGASVGASEVS